MKSESLLNTSCAQGGVNRAVAHGWLDGISLVELEEYLIDLFNKNFGFSGVERDEEGVSGVGRLFDGDVTLVIGAYGEAVASGVLKYCDHSVKVEAMCLGCKLIRYSLKEEDSGQYFFRMMPFSTTNNTTKKSV